MTAGIGGVIHHTTRSIEVGIDRGTDRAAQIGILYIDVEVEHPVLEVELLVEAQVELVLVGQSQRIEAFVVQIGTMCDSLGVFICR